MKPRILLLSAYDATSHRLWRERLQALFPEYDWTCLSLSPRHFNWRLRGNSLLWGFGETAQLSAPYDLLIATSMVDLSSLRGFLPALGRLPTLVYVHENQFVYPPGRQRHDNVEPLLVPLYTALCADRLVFNSAFNRSTFLQGVEQLFTRLPDRLPAAASQRLHASGVIPVPIPAPAVTRPATTAQDGTLLELVWNHRWEYDKGVDLLLEFVRIVQRRGLALRLHIVGEQFRQQPPEFRTIDDLLDQHATQLGIKRGHFAHIADRLQYEELLARCDVVLSTARHDFQGLAVQEACTAGCTPLAPDALVYPEYLGPAHLYPLTPDLAATASGIATRLARWQAGKAAGEGLPRQDLTAYGAAQVRAHYATVFSELLALRRG